MVVSVVQNIYFIVVVYFLFKKKTGELGFRAERKQLEAKFFQRKLLLLAHIVSLLHSPLSRSTYQARSSD